MSDRFLELRPLFPRLPREIRDAIWELTLPTPRIIPIRAERGAVSVEPNKHPIRSFRHVWVPVKLPVPTILHVCHESRKIGLKYYELLFDTNPRPAKSELRSPLSPFQQFRPTRGRPRDVDFPYETKAPLYVNLERDVFVTSHRVLERWSPIGGWPLEDPALDLWKVRQWPFSMEIFRQLVPRDICERIHTLAATFVFTIDEVLDMNQRRRPRTHHHVLVVKDPFVRVAGEEDYIDTLGRKMIIPKPEHKGRLRLLVNLKELEKVMQGGTLWDWAVSKEIDEHGFPALPGQPIMGPF